MSANSNIEASSSAMPTNKRKRSLAPDGRDDREDSPAPQAKKKKKPLQYDAQDLCQELYDTIRNYKAEDGRLVCESFIRVPKRRTAADYYEVVSTPIDLLKIQQKLKTEEYEDLDQLTVDVELMINNAKAYYKKTSQEYKDACEIWDLFNEVKNDVIAEAFGEASRPERRRSRRADPEMEEESTCPVDDDDVLEGEDKTNGEDEMTEDESLCDQPHDGQPDDPDDFETLFSAVMSARDGERDMSLIFQLLPSRSKYPEYYGIIKEPIDLKMIAQRIQDGSYKYIKQLERDLMLMIKNAKTFNEPKSQIYKDAVTLKKIIAAKRHELEYKKQGLLKSSERIRTRERTSTPRLSAVCAALKYQSDEEGDTASQTGSQMDYEAESEGETVSEDESPLWALYFAVKKYKTPGGEQLSEPFLKLPSKRFYPDYYEEIKRPISIYNIRKKIKVSHYRNLLELQADLNLVFDNAKCYNQDTSKLYRDAVILQKYTAEKKKELEKWEKELAAADPTSVTFDHPIVKLEKEHYDEEHTPKGKGRRSGTESEKKKSAKKSPEDGGLKRRLWMLYKTVFDYTDGGGRQLRHIFMVLPSRKDYPDYYQVIMEPIDMGMIETKIRNDKYPSEQLLLNDFELMFNNARHYNEEGSQVYQDANTLDRALKHKWRYMSAASVSKSGQNKSKPKSKASTSPLSQKLQDLYETIRDHQDKTGRVLSSPFLKLPLKSDYPDYYEVIKRPVDMQRIQQRMESSHNRYDSVEDMVADFVQMFDNACKYNEPDSLIYKDALTLQRICLEKKMELSTDGTNDVPDVRAFIQELMTNLFISIYNYQDEEGRCYSDSFAELVDKEQPSEGEEPVEKPLTFDQLKRNLDKGRYRRVDKFQEDMFKVFENARKLSRTDSQLYEDAVEMQMFFIKIRDELCKNGEMLLTPALSYTERHLQTALETEKRDKLPLEKNDDEKKVQQDPEELLEGKASDQADLSENSVTVKGQVYTIGDFVYVEPREPELLPHIMVIEKFITDSNGSQMMQGNWFYRPNETFHLATRKFLEKEVFKSDIVTSIALTQIIGRCHVMFVKEYFKMKPETIPDKDVFVCESRYNARHKAFKKIKIWSAPKNEDQKIVPREIPLTPVRVASVFADKTGDGRDEDDGETGVLDKLRLNVLAEGAPEDGNTYYEQFIINSACFKLGDTVFVRSDRDRPLIARIDKIWTNPNGAAFFSGPWFVRPSEIEHSPTRLFYKREVFLSSIEDTNPLQSIIGKCSVLHYKEFCTNRPTEHAEHDVFICESKYHEGERSIKKLGKGLKKYSLSPKVTDDEVYFFRKAIIPQKEPSPLLLKVADELSMDVDDSQDTETDNIPESMNVSSEEVSTPQPEKSTKKKKDKDSVRRQPSGYIVFAGEIRKQIQQENPECSFGDISRIVGTRWRNLEKEDKEKFEEKAKRIAEEQMAKQQEAERAFNESLNRSQSPWNDFGRMSPSSGRAQQQGYPGYQGYPPQPGMQQFGPMTPGMMYRSPSGMQPMQQGSRQFMPPYQQFPGNHAQGPYMPMPPGQTSPRGSPSPLPPHSMSPGPYPMMPHSPNSNMMQGALPGSMVPPPPPPRPPSPVFVSVPPRTQRLLHSEAYLRYIEGLNTETKTIGDWDKTLSATPENTAPVPESRLPTQWLAQGAGYHGNVTNALWALRDFMLKDTLNISRTIPFDDL